ncbi:MAG: cation:proton antiporter [Phycisphaerales bacterium JB059]
MLDQTLHPLTLAAGPGAGALPFILAAIVVLGVLAQWIAWRLKIPSILLLLLIGILAGPVFRAVAGDSSLAAFAKSPDELFGADLLLALVGLAVALILYEGGLTLRFSELKGVGRSIFALVTLGALVTWVVAAVASLFFFQLRVDIAILFGAIVIVTGPTVIGPMLSHIRPAGAVGPILRWEGIVIDPIGVLAAVLVFEAIIINQTGAAQGATLPIVLGVLKTIVVGGGLGVLAAILLLGLMSRYWIPDFLQNPFSLMLVIMTFTVSNIFQAESGLFAVTAMGVVLANQKRADIRHIIEFKENIRVLLISTLFIVLGARLELDQILSVDLWAMAALLVVLIVVARPLGAMISTVGSGLSWNERLFIACVAPRGIVAAAGASIFALGLKSRGISGAEQLVPLTFMVIVGTVTIYGLAATPLARALGVSDQNPQGIVFIGAPRWVRAMAENLVARGVSVLLVDTNRANINAARMAHLPAVHVNVLSEHAVEDLDLRGIGRVLAVTPNDEVNALALQRFTEHFDKAELYRLPSKAPKKKSDAENAGHLGRLLFETGAHFALLESRVANGWIIKSTTLSEEFDYDDYCTLYGPNTLPLFVVRKTGALVIATATRMPEPEPGDTLVALINPDELFMPGLALKRASEEANGTPGA